MSKNKKGINDLFKAQPLFKSTNNKLTSTSKISSNIPSRGTASKGYHYHLLNTSVDQLQPQNQQNQTNNKNQRRRISDISVQYLQNNEQNNKQKYQDKHSNLISKRAQQTQSRMVNSREQQYRRQNKQQSSRQKKNYPYVSRKVHQNTNQGQYGIDQPIQQQSPTAWQSLVIKSSRKYFDSCRSQALQYIQKLQQMLSKDYGFIQTSLKKINHTTQQFYQSLCETVRQNLYNLIDETLQKWRINSLQTFAKQQINYVGQLFQLNTQVEQRYKQIEAFKVQLDSQKQWRIRASQLLVTNYQGDLIQLSKLCKRSAQLAEKNVNQYCIKADKQLKDKFQDRQQMEQLSKKIYVIINQDCFNKNKLSKKQKIQNLKSAIRPSVTPSKIYSYENSTTNKYTGGYSKKSQLGTLTNPNKFTNDYKINQTNNSKINEQQNNEQQFMKQRKQRGNQQIKQNLNTKYEQI